jgi:hypothetical protein
MRFDACLNLATGQAVGRHVDDVIATLICIPDDLRKCHQNSTYK